MDAVSLKYSVVELLIVMSAYYVLYTDFAFVVEELSVFLFSKRATRSIYLILFMLRKALYINI